MRRAASWATSHAPLRLVSITSSQPDSLSSRALAVTATPELLINTVTVPASASAAANASRTLAAFLTSMATARARPPAAVMASVSRRSRSARRAASTTVAPARARAAAKCAPRPPEAPVTRATLPSSLKDCSIGSLGAAARAAPAGARCGSVVGEGKSIHTTPHGRPDSGRADFPPCRAVLYSCARADIPKAAPKEASR